MSAAHEQHVLETPATSNPSFEDPEKGIQAGDAEKATGTQSDADASIEKSDIPAAGPPGPGPPPDGGLNAWMAVLGGFCGLFVSFGWINCKCYQRWT